jgi:hypothetical protein
LKILNLYNQLINPIGLDKMLIEELKPSTNHEHTSSKYNNENNVVDEQKLDTPPQQALDTPSPSKVGHPLKKRIGHPNTRAG